MVTISDDRAFPDTSDKGITQQWRYGLTKREYFAIWALQGYISAGSNGMPNHVDLAIMAVNSAD